MFNLPLDLIGILTALLGGVGFIFFKFAQKKEEGRQEVISKQKDLDFKNLLDHKHKEEVLRAQTNKDKSCIPNDWDELDRLHRETGRTTLSQISGASVCTEMRSSSRSNKKNDAS